MYYNNVIESISDLPGEIFENSVWPQQESYLTSVPTNYSFVRGPEVYSVVSAGTTYFFQSAVPVNSVSFENSTWSQDSNLPPVPTNCFFVRGPEVYSVETSGTTYYYQRAVPVPIVSDLEFPPQSDCDQESYPVLSENTDVLNDEISNYDIGNSSSSSLSSFVDTDTGNRDSDLGSSDSSYILNVTENLETDVQQNGNVLDWSVIDETLSDFYEDNNACIENYNDGLPENLGTDVQQNGNVLDWSVIDETLSDFYEDNNVCIENSNDGLSENNVEIELSASDSLSDYDTKALNKYLRDRLYLIALSGHLYQKESIPVVDILPVIEEECFLSEDDYESESECTKKFEISSGEKSSIRNISNHISEGHQPKENCCPFPRDYVLKSMEKDEKSTEQKSSVKQDSNFTFVPFSPIAPKEACTMFPSDLESNKRKEKFIQQKHSVRNSSNYMTEQFHPNLPKEKSSSFEKDYELSKENEKSVEQKSSAKQDCDYMFEQFKPCTNTEECSSSPKDYCNLIVDNFPETVMEPPKFGEDTPLHIGEYTKKTEEFDKTTPLDEESLCCEENLKLRSGDNDLVKPAKILSNTDERYEFRTSKFSVFEENYPEEDLPASKVDLPIEDSSIPTASTEVKKPKKKKRFLKLRKWFADKLLCCVRKNNSLEK